jgi:flagellar protein FliO/FliZ
MGLAGVAWWLLPPLAAPAPVAQTRIAPGQPKMVQPGSLEIPGKNAVVESAGQPPALQIGRTSASPPQRKARPTAQLTFRPVALETKPPGPSLAGPRLVAQAVQPGSSQSSRLLETERAFVADASAVPPVPTAPPDDAPTPSTSPEPSTSGEVALEFGPGSQLPAILIAPDPAAPPTPPAIARADSDILQTFLDQTTPEPGQPAEISDANWDQATHQANERYRSLHGKSAFQNRLLEAARATQSLSTQ